MGFGDYFDDLKVQLRVVGHDAVRSPMSAADMLGAVPLSFSGGVTCSRRLARWLAVSAECGGPS